MDSQPWSPNTPLKHLILKLSATMPPKSSLLYKTPEHTHYYPLTTLFSPSSPQTPVIALKYLGPWKTPIKVSEGKSLCAWITQSASKIESIQRVLQREWVAIGIIFTRWSGPIIWSFCPGKVQMSLLIESPQLTNSILMSYCKPNLIGVMTPGYCCHPHWWIYSYCIPAMQVW